MSPDKSTAIEPYMNKKIVYRETPQNLYFKIFLQIGWNYVDPDLGW